MADAYITVKFDKHLRDALIKTEAERDGVYRERAHLIAALAVHYPAAWGTDPETPTWAVVYIQLPTGQCSWHIAPDDWAELFAPLNLTYGGDLWDGHTTDEKYQRLRDHTAQFAADVAALPHSTGWYAASDSVPCALSAGTVIVDRDVPVPDELIRVLNAPSSPFCLYQCPDHHGVSVHTIDCPVHSDRSVCAGCSAEVKRQEIAADPYYRGDNYTMFGDDE